MMNTETMKIGVRVMNAKNRVKEIKFIAKEIKSLANGILAAAKKRIELEDLLADYEEE